MGRGKRLALWIGGGAAVFVGVVALGVTLLFRDSATPVTREDVTVNLGSIDGVDGGGDVYTYETTGYETASALGGGRHDYPAETFLAVRAGECGPVHRWQALEERWDEMHVCDDGTLARVVSYHKWFGIAEENTYVCEAGARVFPEAGETSWSFDCVQEDVTTVSWTYEVVGPETLQIGGEAVETLHLVATESDVGRTIGTGTHHRWVLTDPYLVVKETVEITNTTDSIAGPVDYVEQYDLVLTALTPSE
ncbi:MAG: hypothetical protein KQH83_07190 [Actinobacteria bacterium]|nr:hypothetical protein [Actinomycetota bacterium]